MSLSKPNSLPEFSTLKCYIGLMTSTYEVSGNTIIVIAQIIIIVEYNRVNIAFYCLNFVFY